MGSQKRLLKFLYSTGNIVGSLLGIFGLLLFFVGIIGPLWFLIVLGLYLIGPVAFPRTRKQDLRISHDLTSEEIRESLKSLVMKVRSRMTRDIAEKVESIARTIIELLPRITDLESSDRNIFNIRKTAFDYLPEAIAQYESLPPAYTRFHSMKDGRTPRKILLDQLELMDREMKEVARAFYDADRQKMESHGRFLEEKFGRADVLFED